jgi:type II secretory pathway component GspD/PulD (secretin)
MAGKPILGELQIPGTLTFIDDKPYTYEEAFDVLNLLLSLRGFKLIETGRFLRLIAIDEISQMPIRVLDNLENVEGIRPGEVVTASLHLKNLSPTEAKNAIARMISPGGWVWEMEKSKGIIVTDELANVQRFYSLLKQFDTAPSEDRQLKTVKLNHASADSVAETVNRLLGAGGGAAAQRPRSPRGQPQPVQAPGRLIAVADARTNSILLLGPTPMIEMADQLIKKLDVSEGVETAEEIYIYELKNARADEVANTLRQVLQGVAPGKRRGKQPAEPQQLRIVGDAATNRLIVSAPADRIPQVEKLIKDVDEATVVGAGVKVIRLKAADAQQLANVVAAASAEPDARGRGRPKLNVTPEPQTNSLIVVGAPADIQKAAMLIEELDRSEDVQAREVHVIQLEAGDARQIAHSLTELFAKQGTARPKQARAAAASALRVQGIQETNTLIISALPADWPIVKDILDKLQAAADQRTKTIVKLVALKHANAEELAVSLSRVYDPRRRGPRKTPAAIAASKQDNSLLISASEADGVR